MRLPLDRAVRASVEDVNCSSSFLRRLRKAWKKAALTVRQHDGACGDGQPLHSIRPAELLHVRAVRSAALRVGGVCRAADAAGDAAADERVRRVDLVVVGEVLRLRQYFGRPHQLRRLLRIKEEEQILGAVIADAVAATREEPVSARTPGVSRCANGSRDRGARTCGTSGRRSRRAWGGSRRAGGACTPGRAASATRRALRAICTHPGAPASPS